MQRKTYVEVDENILENNIREITNKYHYDYYIGVVKNNAYNHGIHVVNSLIAGGINYLATSSLEEALEVRKFNRDIPILILEPIHLEFIDDCLNNNITLTIDSLAYLNELCNIDLSYKIKVHIKIDSGMNRLGFKDKREINKAFDIIKNHKKIELEGIYSHFSTSGFNDFYYDKQVDTFLELTSNIDLSKIPIVHLDRSLTFVRHKKIPFVNSIRLGIAMFGFSGSMSLNTGFKGKLKNIKRNLYLKKYNISESILVNDLNLKTAFRLYSEIISVRKVFKGETVGYGALYKVLEDGYILTIPVGYADGVNKCLKHVVINNKKYNIVADSMDMIMVYSSKKFKLYDKVEIFGDNITVLEAAANMGINSYHLFNNITSRVPRVHIKDEEILEIKY